MQRTQISSEIILWVDYEAMTFTLKLEMAAGYVFRFFNTPFSTYIGLMNAGFKGDYYQHNITSIYKSKKITEDVL